MTLWSESYPERLRVGTEKIVARYRLRRRCFALEGPAPAALRDLAARPLAGSAYVIFEGDPDRLDLAPKVEARPVYEAEDSGLLAVATGRVFIRFREGVRVADRSEEISAAGYTVAEALDYAPNAAWLGAADGQASSALIRRDKLAAISDVAKVEPQLVLEAVRRDRR